MRGREHRRAGTGYRSFSRRASRRHACLLPVRARIKLKPPRDAEQVPRPPPARSLFMRSLAPHRRRHNRAQRALVLVPPPRLTPEYCGGGGARGQLVIGRCAAFPALNLFLQCPIKFCPFRNAVAKTP